MGSVWLCIILLCSIKLVMPQDPADPNAEAGETPEEGADDNKTDGDGNATATEAPVTQTPLGTIVQRWFMTILDYFPYFSHRLHWRVYRGTTSTTTPASNETEDGNDTDTPEDTAEKPEDDGNAPGSRIAKAVARPRSLASPFQDTVPTVTTIADTIGPLIMVNGSGMLDK